MPPAGERRTREFVQVGIFPCVLLLKANLGAGKLLGFSDHSVHQRVATSTISVS